MALGHPGILRSPGRGPGCIDVCELTRTPSSVSRAWAFVGGRLARPSLRVVVANTGGIRDAIRRRTGVALADEKASRGREDRVNRLALPLLPWPSRTHFFGIG